MAAIDEILQKVKTDLTTRLGIAADAPVQIVGVEGVTWSNGSLGLPERGRMYTMALVPGFRITLSYEGTTYAYHTNENGRNIKINPHPATAPSRDGGMKPLV